MNLGRTGVLILVAGVTALGGLQCGSDRGTEPEPPEVEVVPNTATLEVSSSQQFEAVFYGETPVVVWYVDDVIGGTPETGMITPGGLYIAPPDAPESGSATVKAKAAVDTVPEASAMVTFREDDGIPYVEITPASITAAVFDSVTFSLNASGCSFDDPSWIVQVISGESSDTGQMRADGTYLAPASPSGDFELMVMAQSATCTGKTGIAKVGVKKPTWFYVQLEDFVDSEGTGIRKDTPCGGGVGISGFDAAGEWIRIPITVLAGGRYRGYIRYAAGYLDVLELTVVADGCGSGGTSPTATFVLDLGSGVGG